MKKIQRMGDVNSGGGVIEDIPQDSFFVNDKLVAIDGSTGSSHDDWDDHPEHEAGNWSTVHNTLPSTFFINDIPVSVEGDTDTCGDIRVDGSPDFFLY